MIHTQEFKTKTILQPRQNPSTSKYWGVSMDIGYSSVKIFSPNMIASFPSYAKKVAYGTADHPIGGLEKTCIAYRDENNNEYFIGAIAQDSVQAGDSDNSTASLHVRQRYLTPEFMALTRVGLALGMMKNQYGDPAGKILHVQTGLPPEYMAGPDTEMLKSVFEGKHNFSIKLGGNNWIDFTFEISAENIAVMPQPMGTLVSIATDRNGGQLPEARKYFSSNLIIVDPGFGTLDTFDIKNHYLSSNKTWDNLGMHRVMEETCKLIARDYKTSISVPAMQKYLGEGTFSTNYDMDTKKVNPLKRTKIPFADILEMANKIVCEEALTTIDSFYNYLQNEDYLVITGGTGAAWFDIIKNHYSEIEALKVIDGAANDTIPAIFSNVRGYYMTQLNTLKNKQ